MNPLISRRLLAQYLCKSLSFRLYAFLRVLSCPYDRIALYVPACQNLLDVGCGVGLWLNYLALNGGPAELQGVDVDARKLAIAKTSKNDNIRFHDAEHFRWASDSFDCVTVIDVLYLLDAAAKRELFRDIYITLRYGGTALVKEIDVRPFWKYALSWMQELIAVRLLGLTSGSGLYFSSPQEYARLMKEAGFARVDIKRLDAWCPYPSVLLIGEKEIHERAADSG